MISKKYHLPLFVSSVVAGISLLIIFFILWSKPPTIDGFRKIELIGNFYNPAYEMPDTVIHYELNKNQLVLTFDTAPKHKNWIIDVHLTNNGSGPHWHSLSPKRKYAVKNNRIVLDNLNLRDSFIDSSFLLLEAAPDLDESAPILTNVFFANILIKFVRNGDVRSGTFTPSNHPPFHYVSFDMDYVKSLPEHESEFLLRFLKLKLHQFSWNGYQKYPAMHHNSKKATE